MSAEMKQNMIGEVLVSKITDLINEQTEATGDTIAKTSFSVLVNVIVAMAEHARSFTDEEERAEWLQATTSVAMTFAARLAQIALKLDDASAIEELLNEMRKGAAEVSTKH